MLSQRRYVFSSTSAVRLTPDDRARESLDARVPFVSQRISLEESTKKSGVKRCSCGDAGFCREK
jgi:hypothetical protein